MLKTFLNPFLRTFLGTLLGPLVGTVLGSQLTLAQAPRRPAEVPALGQPSRWESYVAPAVVFAERARAMPLAGIHRPITHPVVGLLGIAGEAYATVDPGVQPGARLLATSRVLGLSVGADWDGRTRELDAVFSLRAAVQRGGFFGNGTMLRADWLPGRDDALVFGLEMPLGQPYAGKSRQRRTDAALPSARRVALTDGVPPDAEPALTRLQHSSATLLEYTNLYPETNGALNYGPSYTAVVRMYHESLAEAFRVAAKNPLIGDRVTRRARAGALDAVLLPYDSLFGQVKEQSASIRPLTSAAHASFVAWLRDSLRVSVGDQKRVAAVHGHWMGVLERAHETLLDQWRDSRLVWMPLQLALTEEEYDEQSEVDVLIERAVGRPFTDENALTYLRSADLPLEVARSIFAARDYHVLWTHDFAGRRDDTRTLDEISYSMVADAYLPALTQAVARYDSTRVLPVYMVLIDQFYYAQRNGRLWMDILENPLHARIRLPAGAGNAEREAHLRKRQQELRDAVAKSWRLRQDAAVNGGDRWIPDVIRVNVNVLHPADWSFRSDRIVPPWPFVPDNIIRDHRKLVFYDVTESNPYSGATIVMGVGIGEQYASPTWEDRGYRVRGRAGLEVRDAARRALLANGMRERDIPFPLRATKPANGAGRFTANGALANEPGDSTDDRYVGRALQLHNETGFAPKKSSVARAMLYNLAPAGSVIIVPDPLWVSDTWAAMLAGAAARGCKVFVIAPSHVNNPNPHPPIEAVEHDVMLRLLQSRDRMREQMQRTGGELRVGLFTAKHPISDPAGRAREVKEGIRRYPWISQVIPFDERALAVLDRATQRTERDGRDATAMAQDETPRAPLLHQKTQLIARPGAIAALVRQPGWEDVLASAMRAQSQQTVKFADQLGFMNPDVDSAAIRSADAMLRGFESTLSEADRKAVSFYFSLGTQNQDPRGLMLDGEATLLVSGFHAATGLADLYYIMARSTWLDTPAELDRLLPRPRGIMGRLARMIRFAL